MYTLKACFIVLITEYNRNDISTNGDKGVALALRRRT